MKIISAPDAVQTMRGNKLRKFPSRGKFQERMKPFARPEIKQSYDLPSQPSCFMIGGCLARAFERSANWMGLPVLSAHYALQQKIPEFTPPLTFHKPLIASAENEIDWFLDEPADGGVSSLVDLNGELIDMQISPQFSHKAEKAAQLRRLYNKTYRGILEADLIFLNLGSTECWFDNQTGVYVNGLPPGQFLNHQPERFSLHVWGVDDIRGCVERIVRKVNNHRPERPAMFVVCVSPVAVGFGYGPHDQLIADTWAKSVAHVAAMAIAEELPEVAYGPIYEFATLTDRSLIYSKTILDHLNFDCVDRFMGAFLRTNGANPAAASALETRGLAWGYMEANYAQKAAEVIDKHIDRFGQDARLSVQHARALYSSGRKDEALNTYIHHAEHGQNDTAKSAGTALSIALGVQNLEAAQRIIDLAESSDNPEMRGKTEEWKSRLDQAKNHSASKAEQKQRIARLLETLLTSPASVVAELRDEFGSPTMPDHVQWIYAQGLIRTSSPEATPVLRDLILSNRAYGKQAGHKLLNLLRKAGGSIGEITEDEVRKLIVSRQMGSDGGR